jgi:uncharacterized repeat protein (TIGR04076 family)
MSSGISRCKITVLKRTINQDLIDEYLDTSDKHRGPCECFKDGQEFLTDPLTIPKDFLECCPWAWADIRKDILTVATGSNMPGIRMSGTIITGCRDWFRPVIFKVERMEND